MSNSGIHLDDDLLAHMALHHLPPDHSTTQQVIIATAESFNTSLTLTGVLSQMHELIRDLDSTKTTASALISQAKASNSRQTTYERCTHGQHNPKTAHSEDACWQLHPSKNPHHKLSANISSISGRAQCTRGHHGPQSSKTILDSGSSQHMFKDRKSFVSHEPQETDNGGSMLGKGVGTVSGLSLGAPLSLSDTLHVPDLKCNLVSLVQLAKKGCSLSFVDKGRFEVSQKDDVVLTGKIINGLMELDLDTGKSSSNPCAMSAVTDSPLLHSRLGHPGGRLFSKAFPGIPPLSSSGCI